jgi:hypothetical protein
MIRRAGIDPHGGSKLPKLLAASTKPQQTIGLSSTEIVDLHRDVMQTLAFQYFGQKVAFYPDSDPGSFDKRNVRDGHYFMWIPLHVLAHTSAGSVIGGNNDLEVGASKVRDATTTRDMFQWLTGRKAFPGGGFSVIAAEKQGGLTPQCAIHVTGAREGAPLEPYTPPQPCDCAFESASPGLTPPACRKCSTNTDCTAVAGRPNCNYGYCEPG